MFGGQIFLFQIVKVYPQAHIFAAKKFWFSKFLVKQIQILILGKNADFDHSKKTGPQEITAIVNVGRTNTAITHAQIILEYNINRDTNWAEFELFQTILSWFNVILLNY